jgi:superoxide dismutase, Fe-Mn family
MDNPIRKTIELLEEKSRQELVLNPLPYGREDLEPVMSSETLDYHYGRLAKSYVERYNLGEGDADFNEAGAFLHNIFFTQLKAPSASNRPRGASLALINDRYGDFSEFRSQVLAQAMSIQGSGWVYMARNGDIKTMANHAMRRDIALLIDWWEHAWVLDYQHDKKKYLKNHWRIVDWDAVNQRL